MSEYELGDCVKFEIDVKDADGNLTDPSALTIEIKDASDGTEMVAQTSILANKDDTGEYHYYWQTTESMSTGEYEVEVRATISTRTILQRDLVTLIEVI